MKLDGHTEYFECTCTTAEHIMRVYADIDPDFPCLWFEVQASKPRFWTRLRRSFRYLFGGSGDLFWGETLVEPKDKNRLLSVINMLPEPEENNGANDKSQ